MKRKIIIIVTVIAVIASLFAVALTQKDSTDTTSPSGESTTENTGNTIHLTPDTKSLVVYAPLHCEVFLGSQKVPYNETVNCYRLFSELKGKHTLTVSKYGCNTVTKEIDFDKEVSAEVKISLTRTEEYEKELLQVAEKNLRDFIAVCNTDEMDISAFNFYAESDKKKIESHLDSVSMDLAVDSMHYSTGDIKISALRCDGVADGGKTDPYEYDAMGTVVKFTLDYNYSWEYKETADDSSGVKSVIIKPFIKMEYIDGEWYVRDLFLQLRK